MDQVDPQTFAVAGKDPTFTVNGQTITFPQGQSVVLQFNRAIETPKAPIPTESATTKATAEQDTNPTGEQPTKSTAQKDTKPSIQKPTKASGKATKLTQSTKATTGNSTIAPTGETTEITIENSAIAPT